MLSKSSFDDRFLADSFYQALLNRFCDSFDRTTQMILSECEFGMAPSPTGEKTFFILAPDMEKAEYMTQQVDNIIERVVALMVGVKQTAICVVPPKAEENNTAHAPARLQTIPKYMLAKIFPHPSQTTDENN